MFNKYRAKRTNGFASKHEASVHTLLQLYESSGKIKEIKCQQSVVLVPGPVKHRINWKVDFSCFNLETNELEYHEVKGFETQDYKIKLKLWRANPPATLHIWKGTHRRPFIYETIKRLDK